MPVSRPGSLLLVVFACNNADPSDTAAAGATDVGSSSGTGPGTTGAPTSGVGTSTGVDDVTGSSGGFVTDTTDGLTSSATTTTAEDTTGEPPLVCPQVADAVIAAELADEDLQEVSGLIASRTQPGVFWLHNDSGDDPRFFAVDAGGQRLAVYNVGGAEAVDWEDMASGPGPSAGEYLYFGDIGDNAEERDKITIYRVPEPDAASVRDGGEVEVDAVEVIDLVYPDGPHNAETLLVDPRTGDLVIVAKGDPTRVFQVPGPVAAGGPYMLEEVVPIDVSSVIATGGDVSPGGEYIAVRTYTEARLWLRHPGTSIAEAFAGEPCVIPLAYEKQGETLTFAGDGGGYYTVSEGEDVPVHWYAFE